MRDKYTINEASEILGISPDGVRKRIQRGTIQAEKEQDGTWTVFLDVLDEATGKPQKGENKEGNINIYLSKIEVLERLIEAKNQEVEYLREENKRKDSIVMNLSNKIPQLEAKDNDEPRSLWQRIKGLLS